MIDYHDNMTFVNQGDRARTFTINKSARGALMAYVADKDGKVLATKCTIVPIEAGDVTFCPAGTGHGVMCVGDEPLELIALILYE